MQLLALDQNANLILALNAHKKVPYRCHECAGIVFLRGGKEIQAHFFHKEHRSCRHNAKGLDHLQIQVRIQKELLGGLIEERFLRINRVADVCSHSLKLIVEIQCSSMSLLELKTRTLD
ncbi:MAG: competence protein CoiA family protein, partial [Chlamydiota bacterium]